MSSLKYERYKTQRYFYVSTYRKIILLMIYSVSLNVILFALGTYIFFNEQPPEYYGTNGATNPVQLSAMNTPNNSSIPLLPDDIPLDEKPVSAL
jgi:hypothetical protein